MLLQLRTPINHQTAILKTMNAFEADLLLRQRLMMQKEVGPSAAHGLAVLPSLPSLLELQFRQHAPQHQFFLFPNHAGTLVPFLPLDPATALLVESQSRFNDLAMMAMADKARRLEQLRHTNVDRAAARRSSGISAAAVQAGPCLPTISYNQDHDDDEDDDELDERETAEEEGEIAHENHSIESSKDSKPYDDDSRSASFNSRRSATAGTSQSASKKESKKDIRWLATYEELKAYHKRFGDCIVPRGYSVNTRLASWVAEQRKQYKLLNSGKPSSITYDRIALLNQLDFAWNAQEAAWDRHMRDLHRFRKEHGHCLVPLNNPNYPKLGLWVKEQRRHFTLMKQGKTSHMNEERAEELEAVGFCWDTHEAIWLERLRELSDYKARFGSCVVPTNFPENPKLGTWVHHQQRQYKLFHDNDPSHITEERIRALDRLGFVWNPRGRSEPTRGADSTSLADDELSCLDLRPQKRRRSS